MFCYNFRIINISITKFRVKFLLESNFTWHKAKNNIALIRQKSENLHTIIIRLLFQFQKKFQKKNVLHVSTSNKNFIYF